MKKLLSALLAFILLLIPFQASAQEQRGSITIEKRMSELDTPIVHSVTFELTGGDLTQPLRLHSDNYTVRFDDLAPGTYTIREIATRTGDIARGTIAPVTVSIPQGPLFDVTLSPKTQHLTLLKSASTSADVRGLTPDSNFIYHLDGTVPLPDTNGELHRYVLRDSLPAGITLTGSSTMQMQTATGTTNLVANEHYTVTTQGDSTITAAFTSQGLQVLAQERSTHDDLKVHFSFGVHASSTLRGGSQVLNIANLYPDGFPEDGDKSVISNEHSLRVTSPSFPTLPIIPGIPGLPTTTTTPALPASTTPVAPTTAVASPNQTEARSNALASTGASVLGVVGLGAILIIIGFTVILRGRREK